MSQTDEVQITTASAVNEQAHPNDSGKPLDAAELATDAGGQQCQMPLEPICTPEKVLKILRDAKVRVFCDQFGHAYAYLPWDMPTDHWECLPIKSRIFRNRVSGLLRRAVNMRIKARHLKEIMQELELQAEGAELVDLDNRVGAAEGGVRIDLGDESWRTILVTRSGYAVVQEREPHFYRAKHQRPLPEPVPGGQVWELFDYVPVGDGGDRLLILTWFAAGLCPGTPVPILVFAGQQGSAKTTCCRRIRSLIDPSVVPLLEIERRHIMQVFYHHAAPCFDNTGSLNRRDADIFCRAVTGDGVERRKLFTNTEAEILAFRRAIMMSAIDIPSDRPDFRDRCLIVRRTRLNEFEAVANLDARFEQARPRLFGSLLDLLAKTLSYLDSAPSTGEFRMADFARLGRAVATVLGKTPEDFDTAYRANLAEQSRELVDDSTFAQAVITFARKHQKDPGWTGNTQDLLKELVEPAGPNTLSPKDDSWPKSPRWASTRLGELAPALASEKIIVERLPRENNRRPWKIYAIE